MILKFTYEQVVT